MSETRPDPERIYLEPAPGSPEGRMWCEDDVWIDGDEPGGVEYVRADLHDAEIDRLRRIIVADGLDPDAPIPPGLATEIARLTRGLEEAREVLEDVRDALEVLPPGILGEASEVVEASDGEVGVRSWTIRDELIDRVSRALRSEWRIDEPAREIARLTRELEAERERERELREALEQAAAYMPQHRAIRGPLMQCTACDRLRGPNVELCLECVRQAIDRALSTPQEASGAD